MKQLLANRRFNDTDANCFAGVVDTGKKSKGPKILKSFSEKSKNYKAVKLQTEGKTFHQRRKKKIM